MPRNNELPSYETLLEFQEVWLRAVALAWESPEFHRELLADPTEALRRNFAYQCPWILDLSVEAAEGPEFGWNVGKSPVKGSRWTLPPIMASFGVPKRPEKLAERGIAFAAYNDASPTYLFTCC
ncbi:BMA_0021/BMA_0022 family TOMM bacteriocin [Derxia gummosa]|uniref:BMA_0021/BMA_0022 family TOMM bacteriocin n=1 Tax=Derxia gummosa DSM 723 TaxID=1121388 RepID=A0A8B6X3I3_9BURK|nr:BMA_0021/BMA_0022 family TOMM bacteriocin [Derxia gummosa]